MIAEDLASVGKYPMLEEDPDHCAGSIASVVTNLYEARSFLASIGYSWSVDDHGNIEWKKNEQETTSAKGEKND